jgi:type II secretory ATPase GspE/PulE/Tfp pilus assembly ATPase PilB-like protein
MGGFTTQAKVALPAAREGEDMEYIVYADRKIAGVHCRLSQAFRQATNLDASDIHILDENRNAIIMIKYSDSP